MTIAFCLGVNTSFKDKSFVSGYCSDEKIVWIVTFNQFKLFLNILENVYLGFCLIFPVPVPTVGFSHVGVSSLIE